MLIILAGARQAAPVAPVIPYTDAELLTLEGVSQRTESIRFEVLDAGLSVIGELHPDYGGAKIENNINRAIKRALSGLIIHPGELADFDVFRHRLRPVWELQNGSDLPLGVFMVADLNYTRLNFVGYDDSRIAEIGMVDQALALEQGLDRSVSFDAGASITAGLVQLAAEAGFPSPLIDVSDVRVAAPIVWAAGQTTRLAAMADLCAMAGFSSPFFNNAGVLVLRKAPDLATAPINFDYDVNPRVWAGSIVETTDALKAPNRYVVVSTSATGAPVVGTWDVPASAPNSATNRGFRVVKTITMQGLDALGANDAARTAGQTASDTYAWADFTAAADPRHDTFDVVGWQGLRWREQAWSLDLVAGGAHRHQLRRIFT